MDAELKDRLKGIFYEAQDRPESEPERLGTSVLDMIIHHQGDEKELLAKISASLQATGEWAFVLKRRVDETAAWWRRRRQR